MARAIWSGSISFGLVNVPVKMFSAIDEKDLRFHLLHVKDDSRIGYEKVCKKEGRVVPDDEIGTAYEISEGKYVYLDDEDFEAAEPKGYRTFDLNDFVALDEIDPIYFERSYFLAPAEGGEKVYVVLAKAMERSGLAAIGKYVMRNKQHLGCLWVRDRVLTLSQLYFADEIRPAKDLAPAGVRVGTSELEVAGQLIERYTSTFDIAKYEDTYRESLLAVIKAKQKGKQVHDAPVENDEQAPTDLLAALRESIAAATGGTTRHSKPRTKAELSKEAKRRGLKGYSTMKKDELLAALQ